MAHSERHEELVAALALGMPLGDERAELDRHLAEGCVRCEELLADFRGAATALASAAPAVEPPARAARRRSSARSGPRASAPRPAGPSAWRALAAAAALLLVAVGLDDARLRREREDLRSRTAELGERLRSAETALAERTLRARVLESEDVQMMILGGQGPQPQARARVFWSERARRGVIVACEPRAASDRPAVRALGLPEGQADQRRRLRRRSPGPGPLRVDRLPGARGAELRRHRRAPRRRSRADRADRARRVALGVRRPAADDPHSPRRAWLSIAASPAPTRPPAPALGIALDLEPARLRGRAPGGARHGAPHGAPTSSCSSSPGPPPSRRRASTGSTSSRGRRGSCGSRARSCTSTCRS